MSLTRGSRRKPPYASPQAFVDFLERTRALPLPAQVDRNFLARLGIARNNEWALTSALKFLGIIDDRGIPTAEYRALQGADRQGTLRKLLERSYSPLISHGGMTMELADLRNYFRVSSSGPQALNAARFFRELRAMAIPQGGMLEPQPPPPSPSEVVTDPVSSSSGEESSTRALLLRAKLRALELLPPRPPDWKPEEYVALFDRLLLVLQNLDET